MSSAHEPRIQFIVSTNVDKADPETRQLIRSHVMLGKNRIKPRRTKRKAITIPTSVAAVNRGREPLVSLDELMDACFLIIPRRVGSDLSFTRFSAEIKPAMLGDIKDFSCISFKIMFPLAPFISFGGAEEEWYRLLAVDAAFLHIAAFAANEFIEKVLGRQNSLHSQEPAQHFHQGVQILRTRLSQEDEVSKISDATISVVLTLAISAHLGGDHVTAKKHMEGIRRMVGLRGGVAALRGNKLLFQILQCDIRMAWHSGNELTFYNDPVLEPFHPYPDPNQWPLSQHVAAKSLISDSMNIFNNIDEELYNAWRTMQGFCSLTNLAAQTGQLLCEETALDTMTSVMYRLLNLRFDTSMVDEAIRFGLLAFCHLVFSQPKDLDLCPPHFHARYKDFVSRLKRMYGLPSPIMLWLLFVGGVSGSILIEDTWVNDIWRRNIDVCQIKSWDEMRGILKSFMWIGVLHDKPGEHIFQSVTTE